MGKKKSNGLRLHVNAGKKVCSNKSRTTGMFKALKKHEKRQDVLQRSDLHKSKRKTTPVKQLTPVADEFRNFDERMAAKKAQRSVSTLNAMASSPNFVIASPTFQFNANAMQPVVKPREVEGFHNFISALDAPKDVPIAHSNHATRQPKLMQRNYYKSNVFAVLDDSDEDQQTKTQVAPPFIQPATFTFTIAKPTSSLQAHYCQSVQSADVDLDPDL